LYQWLPNNATRASRPLFQPCACDSPPSHPKPKNIRHLAELLQDHRIFELAKLGISLSRERNGARIRLLAGQRLSAPDRSGSVRTFERIAGVAAALKPRFVVAAISRRAPHHGNRQAFCFGGCGRHRNRNGVRIQKFANRFDRRGQMRRGSERVNIL
jgi:hypothetical protein